MKKTLVRETIVSLIVTIVNNAAIVAAILDFFGGKARFRANQFLGIIDYAPEKLTDIRGVGKKTAEKLVSEFAGKYNYKYAGNAKNFEALKQDILRLTLKYADNRAKFERKLKSGEDDVVTYRESEVIRFLAKHFPEAKRLQTITTIRGDESTVLEQQQLVELAIDKGLKDAEGRTYDPYDHGTNAGKRNKVNWVSKEAVDGLMEFMTCGAQPTALWSARKYAAYLGLLEAPTKRFQKDLDALLVPERWAIMHGASDVDIKDVVYKHVSPDGTIRDGKGTVRCKFGDGMAMLHIPKKLINEVVSRLSAEDAAEFLAAVASLRDHTMRAPWCKGLVITFVDWHAFLHDAGIHYLPDGRDIDDIILLMDDTVFKASIGDSPDCAYRRYEDYCEAFHRLGHHYCALLTELPSTPKDLPYQQMQVLIGAHDNTVQRGAALEVVKLDNTRKHIHAGKMLDGVGKKIAKNYPSVVDLRYFKDAIAHKYEVLRDDALGGSAHACTQFHFICADPIAVLQIWFGLPVTGCGLDVDQIRTSCGLIGNGVLSRNPVIDPSAIVECEFVEDIPEKYAKYFGESSTYVIAYGSVAIHQIDGDCDGDEGFGSVVVWYVQAVRETLDRTGRYLTIWDSPKSQKVRITPEVLRDYFKSLTKTDDLGNVCDMCSIAIAHNAPINVLAWFRMAANVLVDASKHGGMTLKIPESVKPYVYYKDEKGKNQRFALPKAVGQSKINRKKDEDREIKSCAVYGPSRADIFAAHVDRFSEPVFSFKDELGEKFDCRVLMNNPCIIGRSLPGMFNIGTAAKNWEDCGLFIKLCKQSENEWAKLREDDEYVSEEEYDLWKASKFREILGAYAAKYNLSYDDAYDGIIAWMFTSLDNKFVRPNTANPWAQADIIWRNGLRLLSEDILRVMQNNLGRKIEVDLGCLVF